MKVNGIEIKRDNATDSLYVKPSGSLMVNDVMRGLGIAAINYCEDHAMLISVHFIKKLKKGKRSN